uniref:Reverse transcriptase RNase H-like domain-containing protein n=1 Tax=Solanum lycopersicum TaxID=4081 RepID=A0A3Q7EDW5_SOLLC
MDLRWYYRKYVACCGTIYRPLSDLLKWDACKWNDEADLAFATFKCAMFSTPILVLPDFTKDFIVETNSRYNVICVVLMQEGRPIEKEYMSLLNVVDKLRSYLQFKHFVIQADHHSLKYVIEQNLTSH